MREAYCIALETLLNVKPGCVPTPFTAAMLATAMPAAISPYSIAVAPASSAMNRTMRLFILISCLDSEDRERLRSASLSEWHVGCIKRLLGKSEMASDTWTQKIKPTARH